jgi:dihydroorotate dehydrogenase electron transfer subunit
VLAAGPLDLARAVAARCATAGVACQAALEAPMACGFGACFGCVVPLDGTLRRLCVEGPVVDAVRLAAANGDGDAGAPAAAARSGAG